MAKQSIELALAVLEAEKVNLLPEHRVRLAVLASTSATVRDNVTDTLKTREEKSLSPEQQNELFSVLETRFSKRPEHYKQIEGVNFAEVKRALEANPEAIYILYQMEGTGGQPDVIAIEDDAFVFADCSAESPNRRSLSYDQAVDDAKLIGVGMMSEDVYRRLQGTGEFDKSSRSWLATPDCIRKSGYARCALHGTRIGGAAKVHKVIPVHRYSNRGWRGVLRVPMAT